MKKNELIHSDLISAEELGKRIASLMDEYDLDIEGLSETIGIKEEALKQVIAGEKFLSFKQISTIADLLHISVIDLITR